MAVLERITSTQQLLPATSAISGPPVQVRCSFCASSLHCRSRGSHPSHEHLVTFMLSLLPAQVVYEDEHLACVIKPQLVAVEAHRNRRKEAARAEVCLTQLLACSGWLPVHAPPTGLHAGPSDLDAAASAAAAALLPAWHPEDPPACKLPAPGSAAVAKPEHAAVNITATAIAAVQSATHHI